MPELLTAALAYARTGIPVLPLHTPSPEATCSCGRADCDRVGKHPRWHRRLLPDGLHSATTDAATIRRWWAHWPDANIGLRTGVTADVCDVDGPDGVTALHHLLGDATGTSPLVRTGSGGWHLYVAATGLGNRVRLLPAVDWRGVDGYVVAPPSLHATGHRYEWIRPLAKDLPACPDTVRRLLTRQPPPTATAPGAVHHTSRYAEAAVTGEADRVATAAPGQRNNTLFRAACNLGELVAGGILTHQDATAALRDAAHRAGLGPTETTRTIRSGLTAGARSPRRRPAA